MYADETMDVDATSAHHIVENQKRTFAKAIQGARMCFEFFPGTGLIVCLQLSYRIQYPMLSQPRLFQHLD
jgi:hypothetical protein